MMTYVVNSAVCLETKWTSYKMLPSDLLSMKIPDVDDNVDIVVDAVHVGQVPSALDSAYRRINMQPDSPCKFIVDKTRSLNRSKSKEVTVGVDVGRRMAIRATFEGANGIEVSMTGADLTKVLRETFMGRLSDHLKFPSPHVYLLRVTECEAKLVVLGEGHAGLKISSLGGRQNYVMLGDVSIKILMHLANHIMDYMSGLLGQALHFEYWCV